MGACVIGVFCGVGAVRPEDDEEMGTEELMVVKGEFLERR
jgi:hypothetical protein